MIFWIGWLLSPFTWWNDGFVNLPLAYVLATCYHYVFQGNFIAGLLVSYWLTNVIGLLMIYFGARDLFIKEFTKEKRVSWVLTVVVYSIVVTVLSLKGIVRPFLWKIR
jgi:hypothetical protein